MATYVISDLHGQYKMFQRLLYGITVMVVIGHIKKIRYK